MLTVSVDSALWQAAKERALKAAAQKMLARAENAAQAAFARAQASEGYHDVTGNLRSSAQTAVAMEGKIISEYSALSKDGAEGLAKGRAMLEGLAAQSGEFPEMIAVAAMPYAAEVEARGKEVLSGAYLEVEQLAKKG